ncbi:MAG: amylo-alpha-1,6-glucosidase [Acidimicrobiia bacterium]|nr:amylo-alpha-1,6-glucosidase [Acidimicrobiia bacterium]
MTSGHWTFGDESEAVGPATITVVNGTSFVICERNGDVTTRGVQGVFVADTRLCSSLALLVDGQPCEGLAVAVDHPYSARFVGRSADRTLIVSRSMRVDCGASVGVELLDRSGTDRVVAVEVLAVSDLADVFEVKEGRTRGSMLPWTPEAAGCGMRVDDADGRRAAVVRVDAPAELLEGGRLKLAVPLPARGRWTCCFEIIAARDGVELPLGDATGPDRYAPPFAASIVRSDIAGLSRAVDHAIADLAALRIVDPAHPDEPAVAAGAPWFMTLFGRDSILASLMNVATDPGLGLGTARALARLQGRTYDPITEEQPGRILHELRFGTSACLALDDAERYYGSVDATPLYVVLVHELLRWGARWPDVASLLPAVDAALDWLAGPGDLDGDGFIEYQRTNEHGLVNQGWKDSWDAISFADGRLATTPIALCEAQAYAFAAWRAGAVLATAAGDVETAAARTRRAEGLATAFDDAFWMPEAGYYALALDGHKRQVDALASNLGHLLWCGIVPRHRARATADALLSPELASGWGLRTLATTAARYDPLGYHTGSVWPHDTAIAIAGLRRAGYTGHAIRLATALLRAADASGGRLPELFAGLGPDDLSVPVPYPASCSPQAWASAAPLLVLRALLGLEPDALAGSVRLDPILPRGATHLEVDGLVIAGRPIRIEVDRDDVALSNLPRGMAVSVGASG